MNCMVSWGALEFSQARSLRALQTGTNPDRVPNALEIKEVAGLDWTHPLALITTGFVLMGGSAFFRALEIPAVYPYPLAIAVTLAWQYGAHRAGIFPVRWRGSLNHPSCFLKQALLNAIAFFAFMMAVFTWAGERPTLSDAVFAAIGGVFVGLIGANSKPLPASPRPQGASS